MVLARFQQWYTQLRSSMWLLPACFLVGASLLAFILTAIPGELPDANEHWWAYLLAVNPEGASAVLTTIAGSMITVAGVTFSITMLVLAQAASQYSPRLLRDYMADRINQLTLAVIVGVFAYCLLVLRSLPADSLLLGHGLAVMVALLGAFVGLALLIYFIHHIASSIQVSQVVAKITEDTQAAIAQRYDQAFGRVAENPAALRAEAVMPETDGDASGHKPAGHTLAAPLTGFVQQVYLNGLVKEADAQGQVVTMRVAVGEFVVQGQPLLYLHGPGWDEERCAALLRCYVINRHRTIEQDPAFGIRQLVDIAIKALSPGINDSTTAEQCVLYLGAVIADLSGRHMPEPFRRVNGQLRLQCQQRDFADYVDAAFAQIARNARGNLAVLATLGSSLAMLERTVPAERLGPIQQQRRHWAVQVRDSLSREDRLTLKM